MIPKYIQLYNICLNMFVKSDDAVVFLTYETCLILVPAASYKHFIDSHSGTTVL